MASERVAALAAAAVSLFAVHAGAQPYEIDWYSIDGGGGVLGGGSGGGSYELSGTIGQSDASDALAGSTYTLTGGFWAGLAPPLAECNPADVAEPLGQLDLADISAFVQAFLSGNPIADLEPPFGEFDLADLSAFITAFLAGCP